MKKWIIQSYNFNAREGAASFHIDDRVKAILATSPDSVFISGPLGEPREGTRHHIVHSISPAGVRYEIRHWVNKRPTRPRKLMKAAASALLFPFYVLEKILIPLEARWSWSLGAAWRGVREHAQGRAEAVYSTGGPYCAHLAGWLTSRLTGLPWVAEIQDPIGLRECGKNAWDRFWNPRVEAFILKHARLTVWLTEEAAERAKTIQGEASGRQVCIRPWTRWDNDSVNAQVGKPGKRTFTHLGTLGGSRNLDPILDALNLLAGRDPEAYGRLVFTIGGNVPSAIRDKALSSPHADRFNFIGKVPRDEAHRIMQNSDVLLVIQNTTEISRYTIPSKVYEYLNSTRRILALPHNNKEIPALLRDCDRAAEASDADAVAEAILALANAPEGEFPPRGTGPESAVGTLSSLIDEMNARRIGRQ